MKLIGFLIILIALVITGWWVSTDHQHKPWVMTVCIIALFVGMFMILHDRAIEVSLKGVGTIKAAAQQATTDATAIAKLKDRVEAQSATVDIVARSAKDARDLIDDLNEKSKNTDEKLTKVDQATQAAHKALQDMERATTFATTLLAAQNDNWTAFDQLRKWSEDKGFPLSEIAANAYVRIRVDFGSPIEPGYLNIPWVPGIDPAKMSCSELVSIYPTLNPIFHAHLVHTVWGRLDTPKKERMEFLAEVLETSNSITAKHYAAEFFIEGAGDKDLKWEPVNVGVLLAWWKTHRNDVK